MRASLFSALAAASCVAAGSAQASTWTYSGVTSSISGQFADIDQGQAYYIQYESAAPVRDYMIGIQGREYIFLEPYGEIDAFHYNDFLSTTVQPWGLKGLLIAPSDHGDVLFVTFALLKLNFSLISTYGDDGTSPWKMTISTDPIAPPTGVPEPSAWALMIVGFGLVGSVLRRRVVATA